MKKLILPILILFTFVFFSKNTFCGIYKYVDKNGVIHFTNVPTDPRYKLYIRDKGNSYFLIYDYSWPSTYDHYIKRVSNKYNIDFTLIKAIIKTESDFNPFAVSSKGAVGLMQLMPKTATRWKVRNIFDPLENIEGGVKYLRFLLNMFNKNLELSLAAYNAGENAVLRYGGIPPFFETKRYIKKVLHYYNYFKNS